MTHKPDAPATHRNRGPILEVLEHEFAASKSVLEIGSGTGQHAVFFGRAMPWLRWQTSDRAENLHGIGAWIGEAALDNVLPPLELDVQKTADPAGRYDAVFSANTAHIMSFAAVECMFKLVARILPGDGLFCLYGPFNDNGEFTSDSNRRFDESLRAGDPAMGIRDLRDLDRMAFDGGLHRHRRYAMPSNNMIVLWRKTGA